eukprot:4662978-Alexandrium_andersonii.AAC.1
MRWVVGVMWVLRVRLVVAGGVAWASVASLARCISRWWWELGSVENGIGGKLLRCWAMSCISRGCGVVRAG